MHQRIRRISGPVLVAATVGGIIWVSAGNLDPPGGAIGPTMKTLTEVEPRIAINATNTPGDDFSTFMITQPGSYYLTGNVTGAVNANGLTIDADDVTVDLAGYALIGAPGSAAGSGIFMFERSNVEIRNGTVRDFGDDGIRGFGFGRSHRVISVRVLSNGSYGIRFVGEGNLVKDCTAQGNAFGINAGLGSTVTGNTASFNEGFGFELEGNNLVDQNTAFNNNQSGGGFANMSACATCTFGVNHAP